MENNSKNTEKQGLSISDIIENNPVNTEKQDVFSENKYEKDKIIFDINIDSAEYLIKYLISQNYDFFTLEPEDDKVKIVFRKDNIEKEVKYIKFPIYSNIVLKTKTLTKLDTAINTESQEWKTEINLNKKVYKIISKTVPSNLWEKLFLKVVEIEKKLIAKKKKKMSFWKMMAIFWWLLFVSLVIGWVFLTFILFNSTSVSDLQFFNNLWINTNDIKDFAAQLVNWTFGFILLVIIILLFIFSYKALLTKKEFKKQRIAKIIISTFFLILSVVTLIIWMFLAEKINNLRWPNYWKVEFYDNSKYISKIFTPEESIIDINENIIWPITVRFNSKEFIQKLIDNWFNPQKTIWEVGKEKIQKTAKDYELIYEFKEKWLNDIKLKIEWTNIKWDPDQREVSLWTINLDNSVKITELKLDNGWSKFIFDATDLKYLWKIKWYYIPSLEWKSDNEANKIIAKSLSKELLTWYRFNSKNIFEWEEYYWIKIISGWVEPEWFNKIFVVSLGDKREITWELNKKQDLENYNKYSFSFTPKEDTLWEAYIKEFIWEIEDFDDMWGEKNIIIKNKANLSDLKNSSKINYIFKKSWIHKVKLTIIDSNDKENIFYDEVDISKTISLMNKIRFFIDNKELKYKKDFNYDYNDNTYNIDDIGAPSIMKLNAIKIKSLNQKYWLKKVYWDLDNNWSFEKVWKTAVFNINTQWLKSFKVKYIFVNKNITTEEIEVIETIHTTSIDKEAILDLQILKSNSYVPVIVGFDATNSKVTWENIDKFIFDYWDGTIAEERDAKNTGHKYIKSWDYTVKLTVVTVNWKKYNLEKKLVLKDKPQEAKITSSLKKAPLYQAIDFSAEDSIWEVANYFWDFGDWETSTEISANHFYKKSWKYKVKLTLELTNKNIITDEIEINIYED